MWAGTDPQVAAEWASQFPEGDTRSEAIPAVASTWASSEPEKAVSWTLDLPESPEQREALDDSVRTWTSLAPDDIGKWVDQQPQNESTDHLRTIAALTLLDSEPKDAMAMATKISDPGKREESITKLLKRWGREDRDAAKSWAEKAGFTNRMTEPPE